MSATYNLLANHRLEAYYNKFLELGVKDERDFVDSVTEEDLTNLGLTQVEKNRFTKLRNEVSRVRAPVQSVPSVQKSLQAFSLMYTYPKCPEPKRITDMDPTQNTVEDLMLRILHNEGIDQSRNVCLFTRDGMPLTDDPFFNKWSLQDRHIKSGDKIYAIFTPKQNLRQAPANIQQPNPETSGTDRVKCHVMLKGDYELSVDMEKDTMNGLKNKLGNECGIPSNVLQYRGEGGPVDTLKSCGITEESTVYFSLSSFSADEQAANEFFINDVEPAVQQTPLGMSSLLSSLYIIKSKFPVDSVKKLISYIRKLTGCSPLAQSLYQLLCKNEPISRNQKIAAVEGLYILFRALLPGLGAKQDGKIIEDQDVFEHSTYCWAYLFSEAQKQTSEHENYAPYILKSENGTRLCEPVTVPGVPAVMERATVLQMIKDEEKIPNCTEKVLKVTSLKRATDIEKILLSVHPSVTTYHFWISHDSVIGQNFNINTGKTFGSMAEDLKGFPQLHVTPPLRLKDLGCQDPCLVFLKKDNLGVYLNKNKMQPETIDVRDCMAGKTKQLDVNVLAAEIGDSRDDQSLVTTRTPVEAIQILIDTSSSMSETCYGSVDIQKIHAVAELFDNFASRTMAYDFHHIIGLVTFSSDVKTVHTFTETLEKFKEHVRNLKPSGQTVLYDALDHGRLELEKVKKMFPECRLRILCLTDGIDVGSVKKSADVAADLIKSNIIVDSILLGKVANNILHGISIATGGCCFKPETSKDGLKIFETETVLSLVIRKPRSKADPSSITESSLNDFFATNGYDSLPEAVLPSQLQKKVTVTQNALKKRIAEAKDGRFMEKDRRIMEELKGLHCEPHPYINIFPSESDFTFWKIVLEGPPDTPYEKGTFELYCQFGTEYPVKPPTVRFVTPIYHCNINNVGRICHNILDRNYNSLITMREILEAVFGLLMHPEPEDPLDSILAEEYRTNKESYDQEARKKTEEAAGESLESKEKKLVEEEKPFIPPHLICPLSKKIYTDPVKTNRGAVYERRAIEKHLKMRNWDPFGGPKVLLRRTDLKPDREMKSRVKAHRTRQLETSV
ncbi:uncharacterized protein LOC116731986 [Xiphophorus hellerii]|uniref:uncharacterized protein LOC116731986 n=1 Tax=Xiphophorus hellerii TaxID=8084 RepID=UPI0013B36F93|nr:uncharacterized protein LOC116731986 [Xiphophorus hellerii]